MNHWSQLTLTRRGMPDGFGDRWFHSCGERPPVPPAPVCKLGTLWTDMLRSWLDGWVFTVTAALSCS